MKLPARTKISFYVNCPKDLQQLVEKQIQAQYPHAFIEQVKGYNPFSKVAQIEVEELQLSKNTFIRSHLQNH